MDKKKKPQEGVSVKKVEPVSIDQKAPAGDDKEGFLSSSKGFLAGMAGGVSSAVRNGVQHLKDSKFGLVTVKNLADDATEKAGHLLNVSKRSAGAIMLTATLFLTGTVGLSMYNYNQMNQLLMQEDSGTDNCAEEISTMIADGGASVVGDTSGLVNEYAAKAWAVGKAIGMTDEQCAGMLGNMYQESQMDPTTIESVYDEPFNINGPKKSMAKSDLCNFFRTVVVRAYIASGWTISPYTSPSGCSVPASAGSSNSLNTGAYVGADGHFVPGLGLFGFTGPNSSAVVAYANSAGMNWWDFDAQMAFSIDESGGYAKASWVHSWIASGGPSTPEEAATDWNLNFEGNAGLTANADRQAKAREFYNMFHGTTGDQSYASSILNLANTVAGGALSESVAAAQDECETSSSSYNNSDLARAAVAYAYETEAMGVGNDGTELYRTLHDIIFPESAYYQSCDVGVAVAVVWSGTDDDIPPHSTTEQEIYYRAHPEKWESVGLFNGSDVTKDDLMPGDILVTVGGGHTLMFVGNEIVQEKYPGSSAEFVSASLNERSPGCGNWYSGMYGEGYAVFRNIQTESQPMYTDCVAGMDLDDGS